MITYLERFSSSLISSSVSTSIHCGGTILHFRCLRRWIASQRGMCTGRPARKGPTLPEIKCIGSKLKFGTMPICDFSPMNSISQGSIVQYLQTLPVELINFSCLQLHKCQVSRQTSQGKFTSKQPCLPSWMGNIFNRKLTLTSQVQVRRELFLFFDSHRGGF